MEVGQRLLFVLVLLVMFAPLAYAVNFLFGELARRWGTIRFLSALTAYTFATFILYTFLFLRFRTAGLVAIYLLLLAQTLFGLSHFKAEFKASVRNTLDGFRKK